MPPKRGHRSSLNPATAPLPIPQTPPSKIPRRKSAIGPTTSTVAAASGTTTRRPSLGNAARVVSPQKKATPRTTLVEEEIPKITPRADLRQLSHSLAQKAQAQPEPTPRRPPVTPARRTPSAVRTPGTLKRTPRGNVTVATPHTARAVKQLQLAVGRSGGVRSARRKTEIRRESQRDVLRGLSRALVNERPTTTSQKVKETALDQDDFLDSPPPPDLQSRLSTPSSDDIQPPRLSLSHDPLAPTRNLLRTPPSISRTNDDDTLNSIEGARRAPVTRLSDRLSFGVGATDDVDDTMMNILANREQASAFGMDDSMDFGVPPDIDDDTLDIPVMDDVEGEYTEQLRRRESSPNAFMELDNQPPKPTRKPLKKQEKLSQHGIVIPSLPRDLLRDLSQQFTSKPLSKECYPLLDLATQSFFRNLSSDLATFAQHAGRRSIEETDVQMLMQRQRFVKGGEGAKMSVFSVAQRYLPGELLGRVRMVKSGAKKGKARGTKRKRSQQEEQVDAE